jgi:hypothetical protein
MRNIHPEEVHFGVHILTGKEAIAGVRDLKKGEKRPF